MTDENNKPANSTPSKPLLMAVLCALAILGLVAYLLSYDLGPKPVVSASSPKSVAVASTPKPDEDVLSSCTTVCTGHLLKITISPGVYRCISC